MTTKSDLPTHPTVRELIRLLMKFDPNAPILIGDPSYRVHMYLPASLTVKEAYADVTTANRHQDGRLAYLAEDDHGATICTELIFKYR